jgi:hypothetical protein
MICVKADASELFFPRDDFAEFAFGEFFATCGPSTRPVMLCMCYSFDEVATSDERLGVVASGRFSRPAIRVAHSRGASASKLARSFPSFNISRVIANACPL